MKSQIRQCSICRQESSDLYLAENFKLENLNQFSFASRKEPEPFHLRLYFCKNCDLIYANPALAPDITNSQYEGAAFDSDVEAAYAAKTYAKYLPQKSAITAALDIGTGGGEFLFELRKAGVKNLYGIEPSNSAIATAHPQIKSCIKQGFFNKDFYQQNHLDLISCFQTLEHVFDPLQLSIDANSLLKKDGRFFVVTHNFRGLVNKILAQKSPIYDIEHLQLFSPKSLRKMLENAGFREIKIFTIINTYPLFYLIKLFPKIPAKKSLIKFLRKIKIGYLPIKMPIGNLAAIAVK
ncbi:MAG: class I SAM-dependent methyltransferase [Rickettsiales bacterium]|nr:class I SAM-dependent methyltransferase [Rickettsiales bacterium]